LRFPADSKRSSPSLLARQLRLRLVAGDDSDIPRNLHNIVVSIHAIATFQALHDYLRPRVAGLLSSSSRLSGMFAALAASGFVGSPKPTSEETPTPAGLSAPAESSAAASSTATVQRRRSQRLAKQTTTSTTENATGVEGSNPLSGDADASSSSTGSDVSPTNNFAPSSEFPLNPVSAAEPAPSDTAVDSELHADFTDDEEVDAEVFDDEVDHEGTVAEKTVTLSVVDGEL